MTGLVEGGRDLFGSGTDIDARLAGLKAAAVASQGRLPDADVDRALAVVGRATGRLRLSADHTIVALAGATGSGKSSTFNAVSKLDLAAAGVRRPTTSWATACVWGERGAAETLEWLGIPIRHQVMRDSMLDPAADDDDLLGLVLLDLPDHDSTEVSHHLEVERLVELADLLVWVLDPQKYADAAIHERFLRPLSANEDSMLVVLNHVDEIAPERRDSVIADVRRLLADDGLGGVPFVATSATTGEGIDELRAMIAERVAHKAAARTRAGVDVARVATDLDAVIGSAPAPDFGQAERAHLTDAVADASGIASIVDMVEQSTLLRARRMTSWPVVSWLGRLRHGPLTGLDLGAAGLAAMDDTAEADGIRLARVDGRIRELADSVSSGLTAPWTTAVRRAAAGRVDELDSRLSAAVSEVRPSSDPPRWCRLVWFLQWLLLPAALAGGVWLLARAAGSSLRSPLPAPPEVFGADLPIVMLVAGLVLGLLLALLGRALAGAAARSRASRARARLRAAVDGVIEELVVVPVSAEVDAYRAARAGISRVLGN